MRKRRPGPRGAAPPGPAHRPPRAADASFACRALQVNLRGGFARTTSPKVLELLKTLNDHACNIALLSEIWSAPPHLDGWQLLCRPRPHQQIGGGVAILARNDVSVTEIVIDRSAPALRTESLEFIAAQLHLPGLDVPVSVVALYMPGGPTAKAVEALAAVLDLIAHRAGVALVGGDFNSRHPAWDSTVAAPGQGAPQLLRTIESCDLTVLNSGAATHMADQAPYNETAIDLTLTDERSAADAAWLPLGQLSNCDHLPLLVRLWPVQDRSATTTWAVNSPEADWERWSATAAPWNAWGATVDRSPSVDAALESWMDTFDAAASACVPKRTRPSAPRRRKAWWRPELRAVVHARYQARRLHRQLRTADTKAALAAAHKAARDAIAEAKSDAVAQLAKDLAEAPRERFWSVFRSEFQPAAHGAMPPLHLADGSVVDDAAGKADALNAHFASVCSSRAAHADGCSSCEQPAEDDPASPSPSPAPLAEEHLLEDDFTPEELKGAIRRLRDKSAPGPDNVLPTFVLRGSDAMHASLLALVNTTWHHGQLPRLWRTANVRPIPKPQRAGAKLATPQGFRPISLLSVVGKLAERMVERRLRRICERNGLLPPTQSGFRAHHSTIDCIARLTMAAHRAFKSKEVLAVAFVDLDKAYDTVHRDGLLRLLHRHGIRGRMLAWLRSFLSERTQRTLVDGAASPQASLEDGVPQGSVLSCILFNLFVADLADTSTAGGGDARFADDFAF